MGTSEFMLIAVGFIVIFRILMEKFCNHTEFKRRMAYAAGMMLCYTVILILMICMVNDLEIAQTAADFRNYICAMIFGFNLMLAFYIIAYCSSAKKRSLSSREKIKLKDL